MGKLAALDALPTELQAHIQFASHSQSIIPQFFSFVKPYFLFFAKNFVAYFAWV